jgi:hypothetical protein
MLVSVYFEIVLILMQDRCVVRIERTIGSEIIFMHRMDLLGDIAQVDAYFGPFGDSSYLDAR